MAQPHSFETIYNDQDEPTETQAYDAAGTFLGRFVRTFDEKGRITGIREITDNPMSMFPANEMTQMIARSGISPDVVRAEMSKAMEVLGSESRKSYRYDANGYITQATVDGMMGTFIRTYIYNEHSAAPFQNHTSRLRFVLCVKKKMSSRAHRHAVVERYGRCSHSDRKSLET